MGERAWGCVLEGACMREGVRWGKSGGMEERGGGHC